MRKVTQTVVKAWLAGEKRKVGNTHTDGEFLYLHGNAIAQRDGNRVFVTTAGYNTVTTRERVNGVMRALGRDDGAFQRNFELYFGTHDHNYPWDGNWLCVRA